MKTIGRKKYLRCIIAVGMTASMLMASAFSAYAGDLTAKHGVVSEAVSREGQASRAAGVNITVNGSPYEGSAFIQNSTTYVGIRQFSTLLGAKSVTWNDKTRTAVVSADGLEIKVANGSGYMEANGRYLWMENGCINKNGTIYVPIRVLCQAFGYKVDWIGSTRTASAVKSSGAIESGASYYDSESVKWLSRIIHAEAEGEPLSGKIAVGNVVLNRVGNSQFPNTIYGVIFDKTNGVQFTPTVNGTIYNTPGADSVIAAKLCLEGVNLMPGALFFVNEKLASNSWVSDNREYISVIGNHKFFA